MPTPQEVADFLLSAKCKSVVNATPTTLTIGGITYPAARYTEEFEYLPGCRKITSGEAKPGDKYRREAIYAVGPLPDVKRKGNRVCFSVAGEPHEWYVACYHGGGTGYVCDNETPAPPFGPFFILMPWDVGGRIDDLERFKYKRVPATLGVA